MNFSDISKKAREFQVIDLFSGTGGLSLGMHWIGFNVVLAIDNWIPAVKSYNLNFSVDNRLRTFDEKTELLQMLKESSTRNETLEGEEWSAAMQVDARTIDHKWIKTELRERGIDPQVDIIAGGPPCQGFSMAGKRNPNDHRNTLVWEYLRMVKELRPKVFLMENVKGLASARTPSGTLVPLKVQEYCEKMDYHVTYAIIDASKHGVPQMRHRIFFIGVDEGWTADVPREFPKLPPRKILTVKDTLTDLPKPAFIEPIDYSKPPETEYQKWLRKNASELYHHLATRHRPEIIEKLKKLPPGKPLYPHYKDAWKRLEWNKPSFTIKENHNAPGVHPDQPRVITPRECARLQSFPDDFLFPVSKSVQLKLIGNAVPPILARELGRVILEQYLI